MMSPLSGWVCWSPNPPIPKTPCRDVRVEGWGARPNQKDSLLLLPSRAPLLFRKWMAAPARVRTSTPACTRGHAEGPSLARLQLSPYPSELRSNSAPRPSPKQSKQSNKPDSPCPKPTGGPSYHTRALEPGSQPWHSPGPARLLWAPPPPAALAGGGAGGAAVGLGAGQRGGPRPRAGARRGPARCRCPRPERLQLQRRGRRQRGPGGGLRRGPARSRDYGGAERPLQDRGGGGRGVRQDGAAAGVRQGRLPRGEGPASREEGAEAAGVGD